MSYLVSLLMIGFLGIILFQLYKRKWSKNIPIDATKILRIYFIDNSHLDMPFCKEKEYQMDDYLEKITLGRGFKNELIRSDSLNDKPLLIVNERTIKYVEVLSKEK